MNNNNYYSNGNSFREAINTFSNTPLGSMTNSEPTYNAPKTSIIKTILFWIFIIILLGFLGLSNFLGGTNATTMEIKPGYKNKPLITSVTMTPSGVL